MYISSHLIFFLWSFFIWCWAKKCLVIPERLIPCTCSRYLIHVGICNTYFVSHSVHVSVTAFIEFDILGNQQGDSQIFIFCYIWVFNYGIYMYMYVVQSLIGIWSQILKAKRNGFNLFSFHTEIAATYTSPSVQIVNSLLQRETVHIQHLSIMINEIISTKYQFGNVF